MAFQVFRMHDRTQDNQVIETVAPLPEPSESLDAVQPSNRRLSVTRFLQVRHWRIDQKIGFGYCWAIGIGLAGSLFGLIVADYYQGQGVERLLAAQEQSRLLSQLTTAGKQAQFHSLTVELAAEDNAPYQTQWTQFQAAVDQVEATQLALDNFLAKHPTWVAAPPETMADLLKNYTQLILTYRAELNSAMQAMAEARSQTEQVAAKAKLTEFISGTTATQLEVTHNQLLPLLKTAQQQELKGSVDMENAQGLEKLIIVLSMLAAAVAAGFLALRTTRAIAHPLERVTRIAQRVATESDFTLRAPVTSRDEIGWLAQALNNLIQRIQEHTHTLEQSARESAAQAQELQQALGNLRQAQTQLIQTEKMSSLGQLVAGVAHEINNPVSFIHGNIGHITQYTQDLLTLLQAYEAELPQPSPDLQELIDEIDLAFLQEDLPKVLTSLQVGTERIHSIVLSLRIFSRLNEADKRPFDLHQGLDSTLLILNSRLKAQADRGAIGVIKDYGDLPPVECYGGQLNQVFMNILSNAIDALEEHWANSILAPSSTTAPTPDADDEAVSSPSWQPTIHIRTHLLPDNQVLIAIADNGPGIPDQIQSKLFDPFFTTKPIGKGTGMGLAISYQIVTEKHHGTLTCDSSPENGTVFKMVIPVKGVQGRG